MEKRNGVKVIKWQVTNERMSAPALLDPTQSAHVTKHFCNSPQLVLVIWHYNTCLDFSTFHLAETKWRTRTERNLNRQCFKPLKHNFCNE